MRRQKRGGDPVAGRERAGEGAVIDLALAARGAALLEQGGRAAEALREQGYRATVTPVLAVRVPNVPGGLAKLLEFMDEQDANVEYGYCFSVNEDYAVDVLKADGSDDLEQKLTDAGFEPVRPEDIYRID